ncbi:MAG: hypothetical protein KDB53_13305, partial [Planctomycetes bacterium]|nr:hypothetical protein [Planctomycetota bacterium]
MNQVARVFVVINLLLSAGFLMAAATFLQQNEDWKQKWATAEEEKANEISIRDTTISEREGVINRMTDDVNRLKSEISKRDQSVTDLTARLEGSDQAKVAAEQIASLESRGAEVIVITSGAIAAGRHRLATHRESHALPARDIESRQALAAIGQSRLMAFWDELFEQHNLPI